MEDSWGSVPGRNFSLFHIVQNDTGHTQPPVQWVPRSLSGGGGVKRPGREADHSLPYNVEVKNGGAIPMLPYTSS
jgi:hypothetical protein